MCILSSSFSIFLPCSVSLCVHKVSHQMLSSAHMIFIRYLTVNYVTVNVFECVVNLITRDNKAHQCWIQFQPVHFRYKFIYWVYGRMRMSFSLSPCMYVCTLYVTNTFSHTVESILKCNFLHSYFNYQRYFKNVNLVFFPQFKTG